jgi:hypothetical protein
MSTAPLQTCCSSIDSRRVGRRKPEAGLIARKSRVNSAMVGLTIKWRPPVNERLKKIHDLACTAGKVNRNIAPGGSFASAHSRPPWASMIDRQIDSPIPTPRDFVV